MFRSIICITTILLGLSDKVNAQFLSDILLSKQDTSVHPIDLIEIPGSGYIVLSQINQFAPSGGFPIDGTLTLGNMATFFTPEGQKMWETFLPTSIWQNQVSFYSLGRLPASQILLNDNGHWIVPYSILLNIVPCQNPLQAAFTDKTGMLQGDVNSGVLLNDQLLWGDSTCSKNKPLHAVFYNERLHIVQYNALNNTVSLIISDSSGQISETDLINEAYAPLGLISENGIILVTVNPQNLYVLTRFSPDGALISNVVLPFSQFTYPAKLVKTSTGFTILAFAEEPVSGAIHSTLFALDTDGNIIAQWTYPERLADVTELDAEHLIGTGNSADSANNPVVKLLVLNKSNGQVASEYTFIKDGFIPSAVYPASDQSILLTGNLWNTDEPFGVPIQTEILKIPAYQVLASGNPERPENELLVIPNPVHDQAQIVLKTQGAAESGVLQIFDIAGQLVQTIALSNLSAHTFNVAALPPGIYLLRLMDEHQHLTTGRFVKH